jgi:fibro-slime domain-containing protein/LPXTG-motif cell wall-anchored protein
MVLSIFVSSTVVWELRGTVITMVNEPIEDIEADSGEDTDEITAEQLSTHIHTNDCYKKVLVCGQEENDEHTHTEECYEEQLVCELINEKIGEIEEVVNIIPDESEADTDADTSEEDLTEDTESSEDEEEIQINMDDLPAVKMSREYEVLDKPSTVNTVDTVDSRADGIRINLFDYGTESLDRAGNNYGLNNSGEHAYIKYEGINDNKTLNDILFFAYGTPPPHGDVITGKYLTNSSGQYIDLDGNVITWNNQTDENDNRVPLYTPGTHDKNYYTGDYNLDSYQSGNRPFQGIVENTLVDGYPKVVGGSNLSYLFDLKDIENGVKTVYADVNHLLQKDNDGYYFFNSDNNYAYYNTNTEENPNRDFTVYNSTFNIVSGDHHKSADINQNTNQPYGSKKGYEMPIGFFPFNDYDESHKDPNFNAVLYSEDANDGNGGGIDDHYYNHHFGMTMEATFTNITNTNKPIVFKYSGDDDMWVFLDGKLLLDIGGIHEPAEGIIDFTNGYVWVQDDAEGQSYSEIINTQGAEKISELDSTALPERFGNNEHKWIVTAISDILESDWNDNNKHNIKMFYMERGGCYSNLAMSFNLPIVKPIVVTKNVDRGSRVSNEYDNDTYTFQLYRKNENNEFVKVNEEFTLKNGQSNTIPDLDQTQTYYVKEIGVNSAVYSEVSINGTPTVLSNNSGLYDIDSIPQQLSQNGSYVFTNKVREELINLNVNKVWEDTNVDHSSHMVRFRIIRTDENNNEAVLAYGNKKTFVLKDSNHWSAKFMNLPVKYGTHSYTYRVEELDTPMGYVVKYTNSVSNGVQTSVITNTSTENVQIHVEKVWLNTNDTPYSDTNDTSDFEITAQLRRHWVEFGEPSLTTLMIRAVNSKGKVIKEWTTQKAYESGSIEFSITPPDDISFKEIGSVERCNVSRSGGSTERGDIFSVEIDGANPVVTIVYDEKEPPVEILRHSFTQTTHGWQRRNNTGSIGTSGRLSYALNDALLVQNDDAVYNLPSNLIKPGNNYSFSIYVAADNNGSGTNNKGDDNRTISLTLYYTEKDTNTPHWYHLAEGEVPLEGNDWIHLYNDNYTIPANAENIQIIVENYCESGVDKLLRFRIDEFVIAKGGVHTKIAPTHGDETFTGDPIIKPISHDTFNYSNNNVILHRNSFDILSGSNDNGDVTGEGWEKRGNPFTKQGWSPNYNYYKTNMIVQSRSKSWEGVMYALDSATYVPGQSYSFGIYVRNDGSETAEFVLTLQYKHPVTKQVEGVMTTVMETVYSSVANKNIAKDEWDQLKNTNFQIPADATDCYLCVETSNNKTNNFRIDEFVIAKSGTDFTVDTETGEILLPCSDSSISPWERKNKNKLQLDFVEENAYNKQSLRISNRDKTYQGIQKQLTGDYTAGNKYSFTMYAMCHEPKYFQLTFEYEKTGGGVGFESVDFRYGEADEWIQLSNPRFEIPEDAATSKPMYLYVEAKIPDDLDTQVDDADFYVDEFIEAPMGYTASVDRNTGDISLTFSSGVYTMVLDEETSIANIVKTDEGDEDVGDPFVLNNSGWTKQWATNSDNPDIDSISQKANRIYTYYVVETDSNKSADFGVSYSGDYVQTNDSENPIVIQNKYLWYTLPATGGIGAEKIYLLGIALIIIGIAGGCSVYSRKRRRE